MTRTITKLLFVSLCGLFALTLVFSAAMPSARVSADSGSNWTGQYWSNRDLAGNPTLTRIDSAVNFNWGSGSPAPEIPVDNFSARWTLTQAFAAGSYRFRAGADDGVRVFIDNVTIIDKWSQASSGGFNTSTVDVNLAAGNHTLRVEYFEAQGLAGVLMDWLPLNISGTPVTSVPGIPNATPNTAKCEIRVDTANLRSDPSTLNPTVGQVFFGDQYKIVATSAVSGVWYLIELNDGRQAWTWYRNCYVFNGSTANVPTKPAPQEVTPQGTLADVRGVAITDLIVRDGPSRRNAQKIGSLNQGEEFKITALSKNQAWVQIQASGGLTGWVFVPYIRVSFGNLGDLPRHN